MQSLASAVGYRVAQGAYWTFAGGLISRGLPVFTGVLIVRMLGRDIFGEFGNVLTTIGMFQAFAGFGIDMTATKFVAELHSQDSGRVGRLITLLTIVAAASGMLLVLLLIGFAPWLSSYA